MRRLGLMLCAGALLPLAVSGCSEFRHAVGLEKTVPNEFDVVQNAPLAIPPDFNLRPPKPGAAPTQAVATSTQAKEAIFRAGDEKPIGLAGSDVSQGEGEILRSAGVNKADADIREVVNQEAAASQPFNRGFVDKLMFWRGPSKEEQRELLDPVSESSRLSERNAGSATVATEFSSPPTIERKSDTNSFVDRLF